jgi:hypothetical protein
VEAREHYIEVGWVLLHICPARVKPTECFRPSTLRHHLDSVIDPKYVGVKTSRKQLEEDDALEDSPDQDESASQSISSEGSASEEMRVKKRFSHLARRRQAKANSQLREIIKSFKSTQVTRTTLPRQYDKDAMKIGKRAEP